MIINPKSNLNSKTMANLKEEDLTFTISYILQQMPDMRTEEQVRTLAELFQAKNYLTDIIDLETIQKICQRIYVESFHRNQIIFNKGQKGDFFYIVLSGKVAGFNDDETTDVSFKKPYLFTLGPDKSFGEMAIVTNTLRMCSVKALENTELITIPKEVYLQYHGVY